MKRLDKTKWSETRDETPRRFELRPRPDPRRTGTRPKRDQDVGHFGRDPSILRSVSRRTNVSLVRLETVSWPRRRDRDHMPAYRWKWCTVVFIPVEETDTSSAALVAEIFVGATVSFGESLKVLKVKVGCVGAVVDEPVHPQFGRAYDVM